MNAEQVAKVLRSLSLPDKMDAYGFPIGYGFHDSLDTWGDMVVAGEYRVERGSGIAGRGDSWRIVNVKTGKSGAAYKTEKLLRRALREWLAGPKPNWPGNWYVRRHQTRLNDGYIWVSRTGLGVRP